MTATVVATLILHILSFHVVAKNGAGTRGEIDITALPFDSGAGEKEPDE